MFTFFHVLVLVGVVAGGALGMAGGAKLFGVAGGIAGAMAGSFMGLVAGRVPELLVLRSLARDLTPKTTPELRACLRHPDCPVPNCVLLELRRRGEDIRGELPVVLDLLVSEDFGRRGTGWVALTSAFPELAGQIRDYRIGDSADECRRKTEILRRAA